MYITEKIELKEKNIGKYMKVEFISGKNDM